jgi:hypothetical protein
VDRLLPCTLLTNAEQQASKLDAVAWIPERLKPEFSCSLECMDAYHRRSRPVGFSGGDRLALLKIGQLRRKCRREGRPRLAARLVRDKIGMTFEQVLAVEAAQH